MMLFGISLKSHNPFLGYHGDLDEAYKSCFKTAFVFGGLAALSLVTFVGTVIRSKMSLTPIARDYQTV